MSNKRPRVSTVCDNREEPSASLKDLPNEVLKYCFSFIPGSYTTVGPVSKHFYSNYSTLGIHESATFNSAETLLEIGKNRRTTADAVSSDLQLTEYCFIIGAPERFMNAVCTMAAIKSRRDIIECCKTFGINCNEVFKSNDRSIMSSLEEQGDLDMMKYLVKNFCWFMKCRHYYWVDVVFFAAVKKGNLETLDWINDTFPKYLNLTETEHEYMIWGNGEYKFGDVLLDGNHAAIKWFIDNVDFYMENERINVIVAFRGKVDIFEAIEGFYQPIFNEEIFQLAAEGGSIEMLDYLYRNNCPFNEDICSHVFISMRDEEKSFAALKWLRRHNFPFYAETCGAAAYYDNLSALKWARNEGCSWDVRTLQKAAANCSHESNMEMLEYCLQNGCPLSSQACKKAMLNKDDSKALEVLKLLRKYLCPWDEETCESAARYGNFESLIWARRNGCPWNPDTFLQVLTYGSTSEIEYFLRSENQLLSLDGILEAIFDSKTKGAYSCFYSGIIASDDLVIAKLKLLHSFGFQLTAQACALAARHDRLRVLQWLKYMDCPWDVDTCTGAVRARKLKLEILKYAHENGCEWDKNTYACCLRFDGLSTPLDPCFASIPTKPMSSHVKIVQYLEENNCPKPHENDWQFREMN